ncbi:MAG: hypothetical protein PHT94_03100 [Candidatus Nanoarchaeia archaeon]|nr:hypothetical protein [Candidatus Nanoarchaeia archaeon]
MYVKIKDEDFFKIKDLIKNFKSDRKVVHINEESDENDKYFLIPISDDLKREDVESMINSVFEKDKSKNESNDESKIKSSKENQIQFELIKDLPKKEEKLSIKEQIENVVPKEFHEYIISSFDTVGDIAVIEIDPRLEEYEKEIANIILKNNPSFSTIVKRSGIHSGTFRIQKHDFLAGKKKKKTIVKENGISLSIDIDKTYYSVRMATERKRIYNQVKEGENVLVMFSGIGPYVQSISKNTNANFIYGIEINKDAHKMSLENKELNKGLNTFLIKGDVNNVIPNFNKNRLTIKVNYQDLDNFDIESNSLEIKFTYEDYMQNKEKFENKILKLKSKGIEIYLKPSFLSNNKLIDFKHKRFEVLVIELKKFIKRNNIFLILPLQNSFNETLLEYLNSNKKINHLIFYSNKYQEKIISYKTFNQLKEFIKNVYYDLNIAEKNYSSKSMIKSELKLFNSNFNVFYGMKTMEDLYFIDDINLFSIDSNSNNFKEMYNYVTTNNNIKFDRILMPLPKDAENFLNLTIPISKKNTIVHLYDFLGEDEFYKAEEKVKNFALINNKKVEILSVNKCGQYGPKKYRICTDFKFIE